MSVTTTANPIHYSLQTVLADYDLHHTEEEHDTSLNAHPAPSSSQANPSSWPTEHRRVPEFRPINTELDQSERRVFLSGVEQVFVGVMFTGVYLQSVSTSLETSRYATDVYARLSRKSGEDQWAKCGMLRIRLVANGKGVMVGRGTQSRLLNKFTCIISFSITLPIAWPI
jgi:hypothetical protein